MQGCPTGSYRPAQQAGSLKGPPLELTKPTCRKYCKSQPPVTPAKICKIIAVHRHAGKTVYITATRHSCQQQWNDKPAQLPRAVDRQAAKGSEPTSWHSCQGQWTDKPHQKRNNRQAASKSRDRLAGGAAPEAEQPTSRQHLLRKAGTD